MLHSERDEDVQQQHVGRNLQQQQQQCSQPATLHTRERSTEENRPSWLLP
jgi:hypothetical protein